jgi:hypothetical protein
MFAYLFRPLFFDARNALALIVSVENLLMLVLFIVFFLPSASSMFKDSSFTMRYNVIFCLSTLILLSLTTNNLGIAIRQKTMILPSFLLLLALSASFFYAYRNPNFLTNDSEKHDE